jgi:hypothetical protein
LPKGQAMAQTSKGSLERKLREARLRSAANVLLRHAAVVLAAAGVVALGGVLAERLLAVKVVHLYAGAGLTAAVLLALAGLSLLRMPGRMQVALLIDRRLACRERFSTALALASSDDPFARAAEQEAHQAAQRLDVRGHFPIRPTMHWLATAVAWIAVGATFLFVPQLDLLGAMARKNAQNAQKNELAQAKADVKDAASKVKAAVQGVKDPQIAADLDKLGDLTRGLKPADVRRDAIRKLNDLADKLNELNKTEKIQGDNLMKKMLQGLHGSPDALKNELNNALAKGDFAAAAKMLRDLMEKANDGKMSEEDKKKLADQAKDLAEQLAKLGDAQKRTEEMLQQQGLSDEKAKELAGLSQQDLREALKKEGLSDEQIDKLMEKLQAAQQAAQNCQGLAKSLAQCRGQLGDLLPEGMVGLIENLDKMSQLDGEAVSLAEALKQIDREIALLGEGQCNGLEPGPADPNAVGLWIPGESEDTGNGGGGVGRGFGQRAVGPAEDVGVKKTGVQNKPTKDGEVVASWLFKGPQAKGVSKRELSTVVRAAKDAAAEAITDNKIPRKYENAVKKYFGQLDKAADDANSPP